MNIIIIMGLYGTMAGISSIFFGFVESRGIISFSEMEILYILSAIFWPFFIPLWSVLLAADIVKKRFADG